MRKSSVQFIYGSDKFQHYYMPGIYESKEKVAELHKEIIFINKDSGHNIKHKILDPKIDLTELNTLMSSSIICLFYDKNSTPCGFLFSPLLKNEKKLIMHAGLVVSRKNTGKDMVKLAALGNFLLLYNNIGKYFTTNISSTPSIIEMHTSLVPNSWPNPFANLIKPPAHYKPIVKLLLDNYIKKYFPSPEKIEVDFRRFVVRTASRKMGFNTTFQSLPRSTDFKYLNFCHTWIDYEKQEDIVQVGIVTFYCHIKLKILFYKLRLKYFIKDIFLSKLRSQQRTEINKMKTT